MTCPHMTGDAKCSVCEDLETAGQLLAAASDSLQTHGLTGWRSITKFLAHLERRHP